MLAVALSEQQISPYIDDIAKRFPYRRLWIACYNSKTSLTISGDSTQIDALDISLDRAGVRKQRLKVNVAYHSPHMHPIMKEYAQSIGEIEEPSIKPLKKPIMLSSVTGFVTSGNELRHNDYWVKNLVSPVRFVEAITHICTFTGNQASLTLSLDHSHQKSLFVNFLIEVGPHSALRGPVREVLQGCLNQGRTTYVSSMIRGRPASQTMLDITGQIHCAGYPISFSDINSPDKSSRAPEMVVDLPEYPFDHSISYWLESRTSKNHRFSPYSHNVFLGKRVSDWNPLDARWRNFISTISLPWILDHEVLYLVFDCY